MPESRYFILSTGRTGTTLLGQIFGDKISLKHQESGSRVINVLGNLTAAKLFPKKLLNRFLVSQFGNGEVPHSTSDPLRSIPLSFFLLSGEHHCKGKVIHLIRDPRDFVTSFMNWKKGSFKRTILHHFIPLWQPNPVFTGDVSVLGRLRMSKFEHFCWIWNYKNRFFQNSFSQSEDYFQLKFENLTSEEYSPSIIDSLLSFMEVESSNGNNFSLPQKKVNKSEKKYFPRWPDWTPAQAKVLDKWCGEPMRSLGYGKEKEWQELLIS